MAGTTSTGRAVLLVLGAVSALVGLAALGGGGGLLVLQATQDDADGFLTSPEVELSTPTRALVSEDLDMWAGAGPDDWVPAPGDIDLRVSVTPASETAVFVGVGPTEEVTAYLDGVARDQLTELRTDADTRRIDGEGVPAPPGETAIWDESVTGSGTQTLTWEAREGHWTIVVMNADAAPGVDVAATGGVRVPYLVPIGVGLLVLAVLALGVAVALLVAGAASGGTPEERGAPTAAPAPAGPYPVSITASLDPGLSRWQWLVKWFLAIPHLVVLVFLWAAFVVLTVVAGVAILFTGRYPGSIFDFNVGVLRWSWRVTYYAFGVLGTDAYPPFTLQRTDYPADLDVAYPEQLSRGLVLVKWWLLAIPHYLVVAVFTGGIVTWTWDVGDAQGWEAVAGGGLIGILTLVAVVMLLFSGRYPTGLYDLVMGLQRWVYRVTAYAALMTDDYPPFRLDTGGQEPPAGSPAPPEPPPAPTQTAGLTPA